MNAATTWLVGTEEDRRRIRDTERAVTRARVISIGAIVLSLPLFVEDYGWWILGVGLAFFAYSRMVDRLYRTSEYGDVWMMSLTLVTQVMFTGCAMITGGPASPAVLWLVIVMILLPCRYGRNGIVVGSAWTFLCLLVVSFSQGWVAWTQAYELSVVTFTTGISCLAYGVALRSGDITQRRAAVLDPLTGLLNRAKLDERFEEVRQVAVARGRTVGLLVCDLDHFKAVNDHHGHAAGDAVLVATAYELRRVLAGHELVYRLGGEEFAVILEDTDLASATAHAELVRAAIVAARPGGVEVTTSVGVVVGDPAELEFGELFNAADAALYRAKHAGRNRVVAGVLGDADLREVPKRGHDRQVRQDAAAA